MNTTTEVKFTVRTKESLKAEAKTLGISGYSKMTKSELEASIMKAKETTTPETTVIPEETHEVAPIEAEVIPTTAEPVYTIMVSEGKMVLLVDGVKTPAILGKSVEALMKALVIVPQMKKELDDEKAKNAKLTAALQTARDIYVKEHSTKPQAPATTATAKPAKPATPATVAPATATQPKKHTCVHCNHEVTDKVVSYLQRHGKNEIVCFECQQKIRNGKNPLTPADREARKANANKPSNVQINVTAVSNEEAVF